MIRLRAGLLALVVVVGMAGCAAEPVVGPEEAHSASPSTTPTPEQPGPAAVLEITGDGFRVLDDEGVELDAQVMADDPAPAVASLTDAIGTEPTVTTFTLDDSCVGGTSYAWGDSLNVFAFDPPRREPFPLTDLTVRVAQIGTLAVRADGGFSVGDDGTTLMASLPADQVSTQNGAFVWEKIADVDNGGNVGLALGGAALTDYDTGVVTALITPGDNP